MGRKKIQKAPKPTKTKQAQQSDQELSQQPIQEPQPLKAESPVKTLKIGRKGKSKQAQVKLKVSGQNVTTNQVQLFPQDFLKRIDDFKSFYSQYLSIRAKTSDLNPHEEYKKVSDSVRQKIHAACTQVFREDITDAQNWIQDQKSGINGKIKSVQQAQTDIINLLEKSGTFTEAQIDKVVQNLVTKKKGLEKSLNALQKIGERAANLYKTNSAMDEQ